VNRARAVVGILVLGMVALGFFGGEYSTPDWIQLRRDASQEREAIARLEVENDSLSKVARALERDPVTQEREARENFGMIRPGEILYRIERGREP
jgi:cell division protein FtsB